MTDLERAILAVLDHLPVSSRDVYAALPPAARPQGKNSICIALQSLVTLGHAVRHGNGSKKFARYSLRGETPQCSVYSRWPFRGKR